MRDSRPSEDVRHNCQTFSRHAPAPAGGAAALASGTCAYPVEAKFPLTSTASRGDYGLWTSEVACKDLVSEFAGKFRSRQGTR
jgi:hypothetical protein